MAIMLGLKRGKGSGLPVVYSPSGPDCFAVRLPGCCWLYLLVSKVSPLYAFPPISSSQALESDITQGWKTTVDTKLSAMNTSEEIIPREVLFGNPKYASPMISPDGNFLAFSAPSIDEGVLNVIVKFTSKPLEKARMITSDKSRGIQSAFWAQDSKTMMYMQDFEGDENFHLWALEVEDVNAPARDLTPGENVKASPR